MGTDPTLWLPEGRSTLAPEIDALFNFVNLVSLIIFLGVIAAMFYLAWHYRRRTPYDRPGLVKESKVLEAAWVVVPTILVMVTFMWGFSLFIRANVAPPDSYEIYARGVQWRWDFEYPNGTITAGELHVPVGRPVKLIMSSEDVLHSLYIPAFRTKFDVLPNRYTSLWFQATDTGEYQVFCTEYCGTSHSGMLATVIAHTPEEFEEWLQSGGDDPNVPLPQVGEQLYSNLGCRACHSLDGSVVIGPTFQGLFGKTEQLEGGGSVTVDDNYLRQSIIEPQAQIVAGFPPTMPSFAHLTERQVSGLIEFIKLQQ
jgi:cytochrome c oxidase subunit II